jgi:hypothetical protein
LGDPPPADPGTLPVLSAGRTKILSSAAPLVPTAVLYGTVSSPSAVIDRHQTPFGGHSMDALTGSRMTAGVQLIVGPFSRLAPTSVSTP